MKVLNFNNTTPIGTPILVDGVANINALYGPYDRTNTVLNDIVEDLKDPNSGLAGDIKDFVGLTIGVYTDDTRYKVEEYLLEQQDNEDFVFVKKGSDFELTNNVVNAPLTIGNDHKLSLNIGPGLKLGTNQSDTSRYNKVYIPYNNTMYCSDNSFGAKSISENYTINGSVIIGTGIVKAKQLIPGDDIAPVYYSGASDLTKNFLFIKKGDLQEWLNPYTGGDGIWINQLTNEINIYTDSTNENKYLKSTGTGVVWADLPSNGWTVGYGLENEGSTLSVKPGFGISVDSNGVNLNVSNLNNMLEGYLWCSADDGLSLVGTGPGQSTPYLPGTGIVIDSGNHISLEDLLHNNNVITHVYGHTSGLDTYYGFCELQSLFGRGIDYQGGVFGIGKAKTNCFGGIQALTLTLMTRYVPENVNGEMMYVEHTTVDSSDDPLKAIDPTKDYIGAECTWVDSGNTAIYSDRLYADLTPFVTFGTPSKSSIPVQCAIAPYPADEPLIKTQLFYIDLSDIPVNPTEEDDSSAAIFVYRDYDENSLYPDEFAAQSEIAEFNNLRSQYNNLSPSIQRRSIQTTKMQHDEILTNVKYLFIDPLSATTIVSTRQYYVYIDLTDSDTNCLIVTYEKTKIDVDPSLITSSFIKLNDNMYLKRNNKYFLYISQCSPSSDGAIIVIKEAPKSFAEIKNLIQ